MFNFCFSAEFCCFTDPSEILKSLCIMQSMCTEAGERGFCQGSPTLKKMMWSWLSHASFYYFSKTLVAFLLIELFLYLSILDTGIQKKYPFPLPKRGWGDKKTKNKEYSMLWLKTRKILIKLLFSFGKINGALESYILNPGNMGGQKIKT